jgi:hypothetical protein
MLKTFSFPHAYLNHPSNMVVLKNFAVKSRRRAGDENYHDPNMALGCKWSCGINCT